MTNIVLEPGHVTDIPISNLRADPDQPRKTFDQDGLKSLAASLKVGVQVPLLVRPAVKKGNYIIHDGERRYRAASMARLETLPVLLAEPSTETNNTRVAQLTVNNMREQLKPMDIARVLAGMRKNDFASLNDLAAYLDRSGSPAMTKHQISDAIALVDLPEWAQEMVDAGTVEASAIRKLKAALPYDDVIKATKGDIEQKIKWSGRATSNEVTRTIAHGFYRHSIDLGETQSWHNNPVLFDAKTVCKGCEHLVKIDGEMFCMNEKGFQEKQAEAKAAGLGPGGVKPDKPVTPGQAEDQDQEEKARKRALTLGEKARQYLHTHLVNRITTHMLAEDNPIIITEELLAWHAMDRPGEYGYGAVKAEVESYSAAEESEIKSLEDIFAQASLAQPMLHAAVEVATNLSRRETQVICHQLWGPAIMNVWKMDEAFLKLFRKAELIHLAITHGLESADDTKALEKLKLGELRADILARADQVCSPKILEDIYQDVAKPWSRR